VLAISRGVIGLAARSRTSTALLQQAPLIRQSPHMVRPAWLGARHLDSSLTLEATETPSRLAWQTGSWLQTLRAWANGAANTSANAAAIQATTLIFFSITFRVGRP
jgi:hypothetical protein